MGAPVTATEVYFDRAWQPASVGPCSLMAICTAPGRPCFCADFATGKVKWSDRAPGPSSICYAEGRLYVRSHKDGEMAIVEASPEGYHEKGRFQQPDRSKMPAWPHPVIANGGLYLRDQGVVFCYDVKAAALAALKPAELPVVATVETTLATASSQIRQFAFDGDAETYFASLNYRRQGNPGWLVEGVADYVRFFRFEPENLGKINMDDAHYNSSYSRNGGVPGVRRENYDKALVLKLNKLMRDGWYTDEIFRDITGKTVQETGRRVARDAQTLKTSRQPGSQNRTMQSSGQHGSCDWPGNRNPG